MREESGKSSKLATIAFWLLLLAATSCLPSLGFPGFLDFAWFSGSLVFVSSLSALLERPESQVDPVGC